MFSEVQNGPFTNLGTLFTVAARQANTVAMLTAYRVQSGRRCSLGEAPLQRPPLFHGVLPRMPSAVGTCGSPCAGDRKRMVWCTYSSVRPPSFTLTSASGAEDQCGVERVRGGRGHSATTCSVQVVRVRLWGSCRCLESMNVSVSKLSNSEGRCPESHSTEAPLELSALDKVMRHRHPMHKDCFSKVEQQDRLPEGKWLAMVWAQPLPPKNGSSAKTIFFK